MLKGQSRAKTYRSVQLPITSLAVTQCQGTRLMMFSLGVLLHQQQVCLSSLACLHHNLCIVAWINSTSRFYSIFCLSSLCSWNQEIRKAQVFYFVAFLVVKKSRSITQTCAKH